MKKRLLVTMLATAMVATMLTGCGGKLSEEQGTSTQTTIEQTEESSGGETEVTDPTEETEPVVEFQNGEPYATTYIDILEPLTQYRELTTGAFSKAVELGKSRFTDNYSECEINWSKNVETSVENGVETMNLHFEFEPENAVRPLLGGKSLRLDENNEPIKYNKTKEEIIQDANFIFLSEGNEISTWEEFLDLSQVYKYKGDILLVDSYTGLCAGDTEFYKNYTDYRYGFTDKAEAGVSYKTEFISNNKSITVDYKYGYNGDKPCIDITATYPEGYDGLNLAILGMNMDAQGGHYVRGYLRKLEDEGYKKDELTIDGIFYTVSLNDVWEPKRESINPIYGVPFEEGSEISDQTMQNFDTWGDMILHNIDASDPKCSYDEKQKVGKSYFGVGMFTQATDTGMGTTEEFGGDSVVNQYYNSLLNMRIAGAVVIVDPRTDYTQTENQ